MLRFSFQTGWWPPGRSMMLSRRIPNARPGARDSPVRKPSSSGPRCSSAAVMACTRDSASALREAKATPQIPHTLLFDLRSGEEGGAGANNVFAETEAGDPEAIFGVPSQKHAHDHKHQRDRRGSNENEEGFALEEQAPVDLFVPAGVDFVQCFANSEVVERKPRDTHVSEVVEIVFLGIIGQRAGGLLKDNRILQILAGQKMSLRVPQHHTIGGVGDDPALVD